jgi:ABC-type multidrug transport system fused ATPase/permease subunit
VILVIAQGRLVEQGSHAELMQKNGVYYSQYMQGQGSH